VYSTVFLLQLHPYWIYVCITGTLLFGNTPPTYLSKVKRANQWHIQCVITAVVWLNNSECSVCVKTVKTEARKLCCLFIFDYGRLADCQVLLILRPYPVRSAMHEAAGGLLHQTLNTIVLQCYWQLWSTNCNSSHHQQHFCFSTNASSKYLHP